MNKTLVAVYGSLRKGLGNYERYLSTSKYLGEFKTEPIFNLYSLGSYPGLKENGTTSVVMEVYEVNEETAVRVDNLEGYTPGEEAYFYDKIPIETPWGVASVYTYVNFISEDRLVKSGDWKEFKSQLYSSVTMN